MSIQFSKTSIELLLFKTFTEFLALIQKRDENRAKYVKILESQGDRTSGKYIHYCYTGQDLLNGLATRTVENFILGKGPIDDSRIEFFCDKFIAIFNTLTEEEKANYKAIYVAFINWRDDIYKKAGWGISKTEGEVLDDSDQTSDDQKNGHTLDPIEPILIEESQFLQALHNTTWQCIELKNGVDKNSRLSQNREMKFFIDGRCHLNVLLQDSDEAFTYTGKAQIVDTNKILSIRFNDPHNNYLHYHLVINNQYTNFNIIVGNKFHLKTIPTNNFQSADCLTNETIILNKKTSPVFDEDAGLYVEEWEDNGFILDFLYWQKDFVTRFPDITSVYDLNSLRNFVGEIIFESNFWHLIGDYLVFSKDHRNNTRIDDMYLSSSPSGRMTIQYTQNDIFKGRWFGEVKEKRNSLTCDLEGPLDEKADWNIERLFNPFYLLLYTPKSEIVDTLIGIVITTNSYSNQHVSPIIAIRRRSHEDENPEKFLPLANAFFEKFKVGDRPTIYDEPISKLEQLKHVLNLQ